MAAPKQAASQSAFLASSTIVRMAPARREYVQLRSGSAWENPSHTSGRDAYDDIDDASGADEDQQPGGGWELAGAVAMALGRSIWAAVHTRAGASALTGALGFLLGRKAANSAAREASARAERDRRDAQALAALAEEHIRAAQARARHADARLSDERALQAAVVARLEAQVAALRAAVADGNVKATAECKRLWDEKQSQIIALEQQLHSLLDARHGRQAASMNYSFGTVAADGNGDDDEWIEEETE